MREHGSTRRGTEYGGAADKGGKRAISAKPEAATGTATPRDRFTWPLLALITGGHDNFLVSDWRRALAPRHDCGAFFYSDATH